MMNGRSFMTAAPVRCESQCVIHPRYPFCGVAGIEHNAVVLSRPAMQCSSKLTGDPVGLGFLAAGQGCPAGEDSQHVFGQIRVEQLAGFRGRERRRCVATDHVRDLVEQDQESVHPS